MVLVSAMSFSRLASHRPNEDGPPAYDLLEESKIPNDIYVRPGWYTGFTGPMLSETMSKLLDVYEEPRAYITIFRAIDEDEPEEFRYGDWVTLSLDYAMLHSESVLRDSRILALDCPAQQVRWAMDDLMEWGYFGPEVEADEVIDV